MRARRSAFVVVIAVGAALAVGLGQATFAGADPQGPPPPDQRGQSVEHRPVCGPAPKGSARCHSVLVECKISRADFLADRGKAFRQKRELGLGCERFYLAPMGLLRPEELPAGWGLLGCCGRKIEIVRTANKKMRGATGLHYEMNLLLASLRRVEIRIEPQTITEFLKWKNRMAEYNRGTLPGGIMAPEEEPNFYLQTECLEGEPETPEVGR